MPVQEKRREREDSLVEKSLGNRAINARQTSAKRMISAMACRRSTLPLDRPRRSLERPFIFALAAPWRPLSGAPGAIYEGGPKKFQNSFTRNFVFEGPSMF